MNRHVELMSSGTEDRHEARDWIIVGLFTLAGAVLRISTITTRGLWLDEAITVSQATQTLQGVFEALVGGVHPPLFHILMHFWMQAFGVGEIPIRLFAFVWGVAAIPAAFWAGKVIYDRRVGLVSAGFAAYSPYLIWYAQEARMYSMMFFFAMMSLGCLGLVIKDGQRRNWVLYGIFTGLGMFTHYFFIFVMIGEIAYFLLFEVVSRHLRYRRDGTSAFEWRRPSTIFVEIPSLKPWLTVMGVLGVLLLLWLQRTVFLPNAADTSSLVSSAGGQGLGYGQSAPTFAWRFNDVGLVIVELLTGFHRAPAMFAMVAMWPLIISVALVLTDFMRPIGRRSMLPPVAVLGVLAIALLGQWQGQVLASRYFIGVAAPVYLLAAAVLADLPRHVRAPVIGTLLVLSIGLWANQSFDPQNYMRSASREVTAEIAANFEPGDVVIYEPYYTSPVMNYYLPDHIPSFSFPQYGTNAGIRRDKLKFNQDLDRVTGNSRRVWLVLSYQNIKTVAEDAYTTLSWFDRKGYTIVRHETRGGLTLYEFEAPDGRFPLLRGSTP